MSETMLFGTTGFCVSTFGVTEKGEYSQMNVFLEYSGGIVR